MNNELVRNPKDNGDGTYNCEVYHLSAGWIEFTATPNDTEQHGRDIFALIDSGKAGEIAPYVAPDPSETFEAKKQRRLYETESFANQPLKYNALTQTEKDELQTYYNGLQGLEYGDEWLTKPQFLV
jgi:hypothetical protein